MTEYNYTKMNASDIREILINEYGMIENVVNNIKGKTALVEALKDINADSRILNAIQKEIKEDKIEEDFVFSNDPIEETLLDQIDDNVDEFIPSNEKKGENNTEEEITPHKIQPEWHDHVMKHFVEDELLDGNPTVDGLRRVAELLIGEITSIDTYIAQCPKLDNEYRATTKVTIRFIDDQYYSGAADVHLGNSASPYSKHPIALAETRAEGRALRRALRLRKVVAAEELVDDTTSENTVIPENITDTQINFIEIMCSGERLNINIEKMINKHKDYKSIRSLSHDDSLKIQSQLLSYQQELSLQGKSPSIPEDILEFDPTWKTSFF